MIIASVSTVKDECDIIELFVRLNSRFVDHFYIVDNGSSDATSEILSRLTDEGYSIRVFSDDAISHQQETLINTLLQRVRGDGLADWVLALDADEFILGDKDRLVEELKGIPPKHVAEMLWSTYVPLSDAYLSVANPLWALFRPRLFEPSEYVKVAVPASLIPEGAIGAGNHAFLKNEGGMFDSRRLKNRLAHVPVRSSGQIVTKSILGSSRLALKGGRSPGEGFHWDMIAANARSSGYRFDEEALRRLALNYGAAEEDANIALNMDGEKIGRESDRIQYVELAEINMVGRFDRFIQELLVQVNADQEQHKAKKKKLRWFRKTKH